MEKSKKMPEWLIVLGISIVSVLAALMMANTTSFQTLELKSLDMRFGLRGPLSVEDNPIVILKIDDQSDESTPHRWPWPRS
ncbi:MAG TPA: CHASE2 domain-containing protein, partial [Caldithrix abyssi]|nr:CHASE2 domain-containing protein [Caldithrix abyssi]